MAQSDRFYFWRGYRDAMDMLENDGQRGRFVRGMCDYAFDGIEPDFSDSKILSVVWAVVRDQVRESVEIGRKQSERGRRSGEVRRNKKSKKGKTNTVRNSVPNTVTNEEKRREVKGTDFPFTGNAFSGVPAQGYEEPDFDNLPPMPHERA